MARRKDMAGRATATLIITTKPAASAPTTDAATDQYSQLALLAGRGQMQRRWNRHDHANASHRLWQLGVLAALQLQPPDFPSAATTALGAHALGAAQNSFWLHVDPVHFVAGMDSLSFAPLIGATAVTDEERRLLAATVKQHMAGSAFQFVERAASWFLCSERQLQIMAYSPDAALASPLDTVLPAGADARELRRLMTEWQMLLHEHPVNEARQRRGVPAINALWPWGGGVLPLDATRSESTVTPAIYAADAFVAGVCVRQGVQVLPLPAKAESWLDSVRTPTLAVLDSDDLAQVERDWIAPCVVALRAGDLDSLDIWLGEWHLHATRGMLRRFWRKPVPLSGWDE